MLTDRDRAKERLEQYREAAEELQYLSDRIETLEAKAMRSTTAPGTCAGWSGKYWGQSKKGKDWIVVDKPELLINPLKVMLIPKGNQKTRDPKVGEKVMVGLIDLILDYEQRALGKLELCKEIEAEIDTACKGNHATILKYRYIQGMTYHGISKAIKYSISRVRQLLDDALDEYGSSLRKD